MSAFRLSRLDRRNDDSARLAVERDEFQPPFPHPVARLPADHAWVIAAGTVADRLVNGTEYF